MVGPVAANGTRTQPFTIHGFDGFFGVCTLAEGNEAIATGATRFHIPHYTGFRNGTKSREGLQQDLIVDFVAQVTNKDMEVVRGVLFVGIAGLVGPVYTDLLRGC